MFPKLCCGLGNSLGLIGRERSINKESEPLHANADLKGHETLETLSEAVQCTDDQEGSHTVEQGGHSWYGARKCFGGAIKETEKGKVKLCGGVKLAVKFDVEARIFPDTEKE